MAEFQKRWKKFRAVYPPVIKPNQEDVMRHSFYAGALSAIEEILKLTSLPYDEARTKIAALTDEVIKTLEAETGKSAGRN
jgi:hypothetical protein